MKKIIALLLALCSFGVFADAGYTAAQSLAAQGIISAKTNMSEYRLYDNVLRQEVIGTAIKLKGVELPENYSCRDMFFDVSSTFPNTWACRAIELAVDHDIISSSNDYARPEAMITRAEALAIVMATKDFPDGDATLSVDIRANAWQTSLLRRAYAAGIIEDVMSFDPNGLALRADVFIWADLVLGYEQEMISGEVILK